MSIKQRFIAACKKLRNKYKSPTPQGLTEFNKWSQSIIDLYKPAMDDRSVRFTLSALLQRTGPDEAYIPKKWFYDCLRRGAAAQVAVYVMEDIKNKQKEEYAAAQLESAQNTIEATTLLPEASTSGTKVLPN